MILKQNLLPLGFLVVGFPGIVLLTEAATGGSYEYTNWRQDVPNLPTGPVMPVVPTPSEPAVPAIPPPAVPPPMMMMEMPPGGMAMPPGDMGTQPANPMDPNQPGNPADSAAAPMMMNSMALSNFAKALENTVRVLGAGILPFFLGVVTTNEVYMRAALFTAINLTGNLVSDSLTMMAENFFGIITQLFTSGVTIWSQFMG